MRRLTIHYGPLNVEFTEDGGLQITHETQGSSMLLSKTEWAFICATSELAGWPIVSMAQQRAAATDASCE